MTRLSQEEFEEKFYDIFDRDEWEVINKYVNNNTNIKILHKPCGTVTERKWVNLHKGKCFCPTCNPNKNTKSIIKGVNDIATTNPILFSLLSDKGDGYKYREYSNQYAWFTCPLCGKKHYKIICNVNKQGLSCECCSDNVSYPEKYMIELFTQLDIEYKYQYSPEWIKPLRYDFYFVFNGVDYIVEMDGGLGHGNGGLTKEQAEKSIVNDNIKNKRALDHNYILIRINCDYERIENRSLYIKESIMSSMLSTIIDLSLVDFDKCNLQASMKYCSYISELWNSNVRGYDNLKQFIPVDRGTLRRYLKEASEANLIEESYDEILKINRLYSNKKLQKSKGQPVKCNETGDIFVSISEAARKYKKYHASNLLGYFSRHERYCGYLPDGTQLTWQKIDDEMVG